MISLLIPPTFFFSFFSFLLLDTVADLCNSIMEVNARTFEATIYGDQQAFGSVYWAHPLRFVCSNSYEDNRLNLF